MDDEYLRTVLVLKDGASDHPEAVKLREPMFRGLRKSQQQRFRESFAKGIRQVLVVEPDGSFRQRGAYTVDINRCCAVVERVVRGLKWHHEKCRIPNNYYIKTFLLEEARVVPESIYSIMNTGDPYVLPGEVLRYWYDNLPDQECFQWWILKFYEDVVFISIISPDDLSRYVRT